MAIWHVQHVRKLENAPKHAVGHVCMHVTGRMQWWRRVCHPPALATADPLPDWSSTALPDMPTETTGLTISLYTVNLRLKETSL